MTENWKSLKGIVKNGDNYEISNLGNVRNIKTKKTKTPQKDKDGYLFVMLYKNNKSANGKIHRLIALAFIDNPDNKPLVNHKNGIKDDNNIKNLEWSTNSENQQHAYDTKLQPSRLGVKNTQAKFKEDDVVKIRNLYSSGDYTFQEISDIYKVTPMTIHNIVTKKTWKHI